MANPGLTQGLAVDLQFGNRIDDLHRQQDYERRAKAEATARAKMNADEQTYQHATNQFDENLLKNDAKRIFSEIGRYRSENPDWEWNTDKRVFINDKLDQLKNNPHLLRSLQYSQAFKEYQSDLAEAQKNPQQWDTELLDKQGQQFQNYLKYGNVDGQEAVTKDGYKAPLYTRPAAIVDLPTILPKMGNTIKDYDIISGDNGSWYTQAKPDQLEALKNAAYAQHGRSVQVMAKRLGFTTPEQVDDWLGKNIEAGFDKSHNLGDPYALRKLQIQEGQLGVSRARLGLEKDKLAAKNAAGNPYLTWDDLMNPQRTSAEIPKKVFNDVWGSNQKIVVKGLGGQAADLTGMDFNSDGFIVKPKSGKYKGIPHATGYIDVPVQVAKDAGLVKGKNWMFDEGSDDPSVWEVGDGFDEKRVSIRRAVDNKGQSQAFVRVLHEIPLDPTSQTARSMYQAATATPNKFRGQAQNVFGKQPPTGAMVDDAGNVFDSNGNFLGESSEFE